jgi:hypothetical protein
VPSHAYDGDSEAEKPIFSQLKAVCKTSINSSTYSFDAIEASRLTPPNSPQPPTHYEDFVFVWVSFISFHLFYLSIYLSISFFLCFFLWGMVERRENEN